VGGQEGSQGNPGLPKNNGTLGVWGQRGAGQGYRGENTL